MRRRIAVVCIVGLATLLAAAPMASSGRALGQSRTCAGYTFRASETETRDAGPSSRLVIRRGQTIVKTLTGSRLPEVRCLDLTGDGRQELTAEWHSGGAHCCSTIQVFQLQPAFRQLLTYEAGHTQGFEVDRGPDGRPALILGDSGLAYYDELCFACSPSSMPLVACYAGDRYVDCTRRFPNVVGKAIKAYTESLKEAVRSTHSSRIEYMKGAALGVYAAHALLGREAGGLTAAKRISAEPQVTSWLAAQRDGIKKWLRSRPRQLAP